MIGPVSHDALQLRQGLQRTSGPVVFDCETTGLDVHRARILSLGFRVHVDDQWQNFILFTNNCSHVSIRPYVRPWEVIRRALQPLARPKLVLVGHNLKFDLLMLRREGVLYHGATRDTLSLLRLVDQDRVFSAETKGRQDLTAPPDRQWTNYKLKDVGAQLLGISPRYTPSANMDFVPYSDHAIYLAHDLYITHRLHDYLWQGLSVDLRRHYVEVQSPLTILLCAMRYPGR